MHTNCTYFGPSSPHNVIALVDYVGSLDCSFLFFGGGGGLGGGGGGGALGV